MFTLLGTNTDPVLNLAPGAVALNVKLADGNELHKGTHHGKTAARHDLDGLLSQYRKCFRRNILHCCERLGLKQRHEQGNPVAARGRYAELHRELCFAYSSCG